MEKLKYQLNMELEAAKQLLVLNHINVSLEELIKLFGQFTIHHHSLKNTFKFQLKKNTIHV